jgi:hypothetical protein
VLVGLVGRLLHGGFFAGTMHAFHLTIGPGMVDFRETLVDAIYLAEAIEEMLESILIASSDTASAPWGQHCRRSGAATSPPSSGLNHRAWPALLGSLDAVGSLDAPPLSCGRCRVVAVP